MKSFSHRSRFLLVAPLAFFAAASLPAEVMARHPEIAICDQWRFVKNNEGGLYTEWWAGNNVHFSGEPAAALGRFLAETVLEVTGEGESRAR
jgi:hypothetical protein